MDTKELIKKWKGNKRYTLKFIESIPEEQFAFKPMDGMKTYQSQVSHITTWLRTHSRFVTGIALPKLAAKNQTGLLEALTECFDAIIQFLENTDSTQLSEMVKMWYGHVSKESILLTMDNHLSHHRGQLVVYLRFIDIKPPSYVGW